MMKTLTWWFRLSSEKVLSDRLTSVLLIVTAVFGSTMPEESMADSVTYTRGEVGEISFSAKYLKQKFRNWTSLLNFVLTYCGRCP